MILGNGEQIGQQIRQWRINLGLTIAEASRLAGVTGSVWGRVESGITPNPLFDTVARMLKGMGVVIETKAVSLPQQARQLPMGAEQLPIKMPRRPDGRIHADA